MGQLCLYNKLEELKLSLSKSSFLVFRTANVRFYIEIGHGFETKLPRKDVE